MGLRSFLPPIESFPSSANAGHHIPLLDVLGRGGSSPGTVALTNAVLGRACGLVQRGVVHVGVAAITFTLYSPRSAARWAPFGVIGEPL